MAFPMNTEPCPICAAASEPFDVVDFNKSAAEQKGKYFPLSGYPVYYFLCINCGFCFSPEIHRWPMSDFVSKIYNDHYIEVDPDYVEARPKQNALQLNELFGPNKAAIRHLDYGGGMGLLSRLLREQGFDSTSFDPFYDNSIAVENMGKFNLITAFEVFEHVSALDVLRKNISLLLADDGLFLFSTLISDGQIKRHERLTWWYAAPRNGHISLFSQKSLVIFALKEKFKFGSFSVGVHAFWRNVPDWAKHIIK